jgi:hypothetical protein
MRSLPGRSAAALGSALTVLAVAGCTGAGGVSEVLGSTRRPAIHDAAEAKARWTAVQPHHYRFTYLPSCFCNLVPGRVTVTDGTVVAWAAEATAGATSDGSAMTLDTVPTIDALIADAARAEKQATGDFAITYDPTTGIPVSATIDWLKDAFDDEMAWHVNDFEDLDHPSTTTTTTTPNPILAPTLQPATGMPTS